jgi:arylsulfatase A-like enzyme
MGDNPANLQRPGAGDAEILVHVQDVGDVAGAFGAWAGTPGSRRWIEGFQLAPRNLVALAGLEYQAIPKGGALTQWVSGGQFCGTRGQGSPLLGFCIRVRRAGWVDCRYGGRFVDGSEVGLLEPGTMCCSPSGAALEAIRIILGSGSDAGARDTSRSGQHGASYVRPAARYDAMEKPVSIFVCGVQKGGTTSLHAHFCEHPALSPPAVKELHFFDDETHDWAVPDYARLAASFRHDDGDRLRFETTPIYAFWPPSIARIRAYNPAAKLILLFRDPFDRAWSQWCMEYARGDETLPFSAAIREGRSRMDHLPPLAPGRRVYSYVERGLYAEQVRRVLENFPREQVLFLRSEDLRDNHVATLSLIATFLGIAGFPDTGPKREQRRTYVGPAATEADRAFVAGLVRDDTREFAALTGLDVSDWSVMRAAPAPAALSHRRAAAKKRPNVLFIVADDLNSWIGALGRQPDVRTPAIDALARRGTLFSHAYCAAPYCNASRMSVFTGCLPTTTGVYANEPFWEAPHRRTTYIETLKQAGYHMFGAGKVFHGAYDYTRAGQTRSPEAKWITIENRPHLWDRFETSAPEPLPSVRPLNGLLDFTRFDSVPQLYHNFDWGPLPDAAEQSIPDEIVCRSVLDFLADAPPEPFFCAAGIYKPHLPWHVPKRFFDLYDPTRITLPVVRADDLDDVPPVAKEWALSPPDHELVTSRGQWRAAVQAYLAAISYCDWIVGRIIAALDRSGLADNTIIALWGDNGFHLGEKLHWRKFVLWEEATRVPMIIVPPANVSRLPCYYEPVGLVDLFPTIAELCGVAGPDRPDGRSLVKAMAQKDWPSLPVVMTWGKGNHSVRAGDWRYTCYQDGSEELYNHRLDPNEWTNLAGDDRFVGEIEWLRSRTRPDRG